MNKNDLVEFIAHSAQISKNAAERGLNGLLSTLSSAMKDGKCVKLIGFGSFSVVDRASRTGRNPKTGELVPIPPRRVVKFRPGKALAQKIQ
jgi:DNA-binding protein HU-beta